MLRRPREPLSTETTSQVVDRQVLKAIRHPLRQRILHELNKRVASPSEIARVLREPLPNVSYHVKVLLECDAIELLKTERVRGALEHFYRARLRPHLDEESRRALPASTRRALFGRTIEQIWTHVNERAMELQAETAARRDSSSDGTEEHRTEVILMHFHRPDRDPNPEDGPA